MIKRKMMDWRWISPTTITTTLSSTSTRKYSYHKINNYIIIFIIYTILLTSIGCSPTRKPVHNFQIENIEPHKRDELKKLLITVYSKEDQQSDDENEILVSDWSEREKRTLPSPGENDIEPAEKEGGGTPAGSDSSGFLAGLITSVLGGSSSTSSGGGGEEAGGGGSAGFFSKLIQIKLAILRSVFSIVTGLLSSSSR
ncbi:uncharacterized protein LOC123293251 isoform X2 [Chrysoperla carnea]|uniref:uncharacterized protein LOC123293251 isoform X2 n=1 Tax=Chrysoperla carnea TaxID=189513 RepID=UPI001D08EA4F|nr:uncharacterized protein LOC123293251 isoform X2 [Chrysoperla carnea]